MISTTRARRDLPFRVARRVASSAAVLLLVSIGTFGLVALSPGDPARTLAGRDATPEQYEYVRSELGLDQPVWRQYWQWISGVARGDLGDSLLSGQSVTEVLGDRVGVTVSLILGGFVVAVVVGLALGLASARLTGVRRQAVDVFALIGLAVPNFWLGLLLVALFAVAIPIFPATGYRPMNESLAGWALSLVLPVLTLGVGSAAALAKQARDCLAVEMTREYITVLRLHGRPESTILLRHALRNAALPITAVAGLIAIGLLGGTVLVESVFVLPGLGGLVVQSTLDSDFPLVQAVVLIFTACVLVINATVDLIQRWAVPGAGQ